MRRHLRWFAWAVVGSIVLLGTREGAKAESPVDAPVPPVQSDEPQKRLSPEQLDRLILRAIDASPQFPIVDDERFLRRATLDLLGRQPTTGELDRFLADDSPDRRRAAVERLLASPEFGSNWADYWSDTISYRIPQPELTFLDYGLLKQWLAERFNAGAGWDEITTEILTAGGKVKDNPAATFVGFHQANPVRLASETTRVFLGIQIQCAECHDHPYDDWKREEFHRMAAFFARTSAKLPWNDSSEIIVSAKKKGEYRMPNAADPRKKGDEMAPAFLAGGGPEAEAAGASDQARRRWLAEFVTSPENPWFAKAFVNRIWSRLLGEGFYEPVDNIGHYQIQSLPEVHAALAEEFVASGFDVKGLFRLIINTRAYQAAESADRDPIIASRIKKLRGDEVFRSLEAAINLPDIEPPKKKATSAIRFPVPPKSTRDLVAETFGYDPSRDSHSITRTMSQALLMMNNEQLHAQVSAKAGSGTVLSKLLQQEKDNEKAFRWLFRMVMARTPSDREVQIAREHLGSVKDRGEAFEDLLWALLNSTEFTTRR